MSQIKIKPIGNRVAILQKDAEQTTASGLIIPDVAQEKPQQGEVVAIGSKVEDIAVGDTVIYSKYAGTTLTLGSKEYLVLAEEDVFAVLG
jgi:chaperonin GroES